MRVKKSSLVKPLVKLSTLRSKVAVIATIVMAAAVGFAQAEISSDPAPTAAPMQGDRTSASVTAPETKTTVTKKKKKKTKKSTSTTKQTTPSAAITTEAAVNPSGASNVRAGEVPPSGTTSATIPTQAPSVLDRFSASAIFEGGMDASAVRASGTAGRMESINALTATYKIDDVQKVSLRQYFEWNRDEVETGKGSPKQTEANIFNNPSSNDNNLNWSWLTARYHRVFSGILGSDKTETIFWWYLPTGQDPVQQGSKASILRVDYAPTWTLSPKWGLTYYVNPRLTIVDRDNFGIAYNGQQKHLGTTLRMIQGPSLNYAINDKHGVSFAPYWDQAFDYNDGMRLARGKKFKTTSPVDIVPTDALARNRWDIYLNYEYTQKLSPRSTLVINPYINKVVDMDENLVVKDTGWADRDDLTYNLVVSISL